MENRTKNRNTLNTVLLVILALIVADLFLNNGRALASIAANADETTAVMGTAIKEQNLNNAVMPLPTSPQPAQPDSGVTFTVVDEGDEPQIIDLVPALPPTPTQQPEAIIDWSVELSKPTSTPRALTDEQLLACLSAQLDGRRMAPYCPPNPAEILGPGR